MDWSAGTYEVTAEQIAAASTRVLEVAAPQAGDRVLDVACGTGNSAIPAAAAGAAVTGLDMAPRLLDVARERADAAGVAVDWIQGDAAALPFADGSFDLVVSVFGVIFARPPQAAAAELRRVLAPGGRIVLACWRTGGPIERPIQAAMKSLADLLPEEARPGQVSPWSTADGLRELLAPLDVTLHEEGLVFRDASPQAFNDKWFDAHPMWMTLRAGVPADRYEEARAVSLAELERGNEEPAAFRATSSYHVVEAR